MRAGETLDYVSKIKERVATNLTEREEREKRRRRVLMEQMRAMHQQEVRVHNSVILLVASQWEFCTSLYKNVHVYVHFKLNLVDVTGLLYIHCVYTCKYMSNVAIYVDV